MRDLTTILAGALGGAVIAIVFVFTAAQTGMLPMPAGGMTGEAIRSYLMAHPELVSQMTDRMTEQSQALADKAAE